MSSSCSVVSSVIAGAGNQKIKLYFLFLNEDKDTLTILIEPQSDAINANYGSCTHSGCLVKLNVLLQHAVLWTTLSCHLSRQLPGLLSQSSFLQLLDLLRHLQKTNQKCMLYRLKSALQKKKNAYGRKFWTSALFEFLFKTDIFILSEHNILIFF